MKSKNKIYTRLIVSNLIIITCSLICFFVFATYFINTQAIESMEKQLINENIIRSRPMGLQNDPSQSNKNQSDKGITFPENNGIAHHEFREFAMGMPSHISLESMLNLRSDNTTNIVYQANHQESTIEIIYSNFWYNDFLIDSHFTEKIYYLEIGNAEIIKFNGEKYFAITSPLLDDSNLGQELMLVSIMPYNEVSTITTENVIVFLSLLGVLLSISFMLIRWQSRKITIPIEKLSSVAKEYAQRNFSGSIEINSGDEIQELSESIKEMVDSLISYERSQVSLFRNLSHDLKTPLTAISGYAEGIESGVYKETKMPLKIIQEESLRIKDILEDLIFLSKINSKTEQYHFENENIIDILTSAVQKIESIAILNDIDIFYTPISSWYACVDKIKLLRMFINLLSNALKHTEDAIFIELAINKEFIEITIRDNGKGFTTDSLSNLHENKTIEALDGNGLGLVIVKEIIKQHNGKFEAGNNNDGGAYITISIISNNS